MKLIRFMFLLTLLGILGLILWLNHTGDIETVEVVRKAAPKIRVAAQKDIETVKSRAEALTGETERKVEEENKEPDKEAAEPLSVSVVDPDESAKFTEEDKEIALVEDAPDDHRHLSSGDALRVIRALKGSAKGDD